MSFAQKLGKNWMKGCITVMRPSRCALWALLRMRVRLWWHWGKFLILRRPLKRPSRRAHGARSSQPWISCPASRLIPSCKDIR